MHFTRAFIAVAALFLTSTTALPIATSERITEGVNNGMDVVNVPIQRRPWEPGHRGHNTLPPISPSDWEASIYKETAAQNWPDNDHHNDNLAPILPRVASEEEIAKYIEPRDIGYLYWWCPLSYPVFGFDFGCKKGGGQPTGTLREYYD